MAVRGADDGSRRILDLDGHDAYRVLDIGPDAAEAQIVAAYRRAMTRAHPDTGGSAEAAKLVNCAFDVLTRHRVEYDRYRSDLRAGMITGLAADPRAQRAEAAADDLRVTRIGPDGGVRFSWPGADRNGTTRTTGATGPTRSPFGQRDDHFGLPDDPFSLPDDHFGASDDPFSLPDDPFSPPDDHDGGSGDPFGASGGGSIDDPGSQRDGGRAGSRFGAGAQFAAFASAAHRSWSGDRARLRSGARSAGRWRVLERLGRAVRSIGGVPGRLVGVPGRVGVRRRPGARALPIVTVGVVLGLAVVALVGIIGVWGRSGGQGSATVQPWTTSQLSASRLPAVPPPAPSPPTPGVTVRAAGAAASPASASTTATRAATAPGHACEVRADGSLWCSGANGHGELGDGTTVDRADPVRVGGPDARWLAVVIGPAATCALQQDNGLWCWGDNTFGELGDGGFLPRRSPAQVTPGSGWLAVALDTHTCAVRSDHTLWCWGANTRRELNDGTTTNRPLPQRVGSQTGWAAVTVGPGTTCGIRQNGTRSCWGQG